MDESNRHYVSVAKQTNTPRHKLHAATDQQFLSSKVIQKAAEGHRRSLNAVISFNNTHVIGGDGRLHKKAV